MEKLAATTESRKDTGEYWKMIMKDQEMPEGLQGLVSFQSENNPKTQEQLGKGSKNHCEESLVTNTQVNSDFEPIPSVTKYDDLEFKSSIIKNDDFESRPSVTKHDDFELKSSVTKNNDFEPRPSVTKYDNFEPRPSVTKYDDFELRSSVTENDDFEPRPNISKYDDFASRSNTKYDSEPKASATKYSD